MDMSITTSHAKLIAALQAVKSEGARVNISGRLYEVAGSAFANAENAVYYFGLREVDPFPKPEPGKFYWCEVGLTGHRHAVLFRSRSGGWALPGRKEKPVRGVIEPMRREDGSLYEVEAPQ